MNGHTLLTAPANVFTTEVEKALHANEHFLWMQGRFVGAEKANRNGAFWKTEDLELGELTVRHGPLNWLHEARHVIGTIADTRLVVRDEQLAMDLDQPHISALSAIWKWIYPDEAWVIEQASDARKLWYSMECVSKEVACVGDNGCGAKASYSDYLSGQGGTCSHGHDCRATARSCCRRSSRPGAPWRSPRGDHLGSEAFGSPVAAGERPGAEHPGGLSARTVLPQRALRAQATRLSATLTAPPIDVIPR